MQRMPEIFTSLHPLIVQQTNVGLGILWEVTTLLVLLLTRCLGNNVSRRWRGHGGHAWIAAIMHVSRRWREMATLASYVSLGTEVNVLAAHDCQACVPSRPRFVPRKLCPLERCTL